MSFFFNFILFYATKLVHCQQSRSKPLIPLEKGLKAKDCEDLNMNMKMVNILFVRIFAAILSPSL